MFEVQARSFRSARYWFSMRHKIDMEPEYQRAGNIWSVEDKQYLIDSIINEFDVPKLYLADFTTIKSPLNEDNLQYSVIDGKQRIEAIFGFLQNEFPLSKSFEYHKGSNIRISGLYYRYIVRSYESVAATLEEYPMPIMHVVTDEPNKINELFVRLNKGATLTGAEKRNAMIGPVPKLLRRLAEHQFFQNCVRYQVKRGQNLNAAAKLLLFELAGEPTDTKKSNLDNMVDIYADQTGLVQAAFERVVNGLDRLSSVFGQRDPLLSSQGQIPVYYWTARNMKNDSIGRFRAFLTWYTQEIKSIDDADFLDIDLEEYRLASRSVNDGWSHSKRSDLLISEFRRWIVDN